LKKAPWVSPAISFIRILNDCDTCGEYLRFGKHIQKEHELAFTIGCDECGNHFEVKRVRERH
jgi:hypothetical protein